MPEWPNLTLGALQWPAMIIALIGAWYVGHAHPRARMWGFWGFLISNILWVAWALHNHAWGLLIMQALFIVTSARGIYQNYRAHHS